MDRACDAGSEALSHFVVLASLLSGLLMPATVQAYLLDTTDAAVLGPGQLQLEVQPLGIWVEEGAVDYLASVSLYYGVARGWDLTLQARPGLGEGGVAYVTDAAAYARVLIHPGSLQEGSGPSLAVQVGVLAPDTRGQAGVGGAVLLAASFASNKTAIHFNAELGWRAGEGATLTEYVLVTTERRSPTRPLAELVVTQGDEHSVSLLLGLEHDAGGVTLGLGARAALLFDRGLARSEFELRTTVAWDPGGPQDPGTSTSGAASR